MIVLLRIADTLRRFVWRVFGPRMVGVRGLVVDGEGKVLLVHHTYGRPAWHLPGGGVKRRESITDALHRELREEAGVRINGPVTLLGTYSNLREGKSDHVSVFVVGEWTDQVGASTGGAEISDRGFFDPNELPDTTTPGTRRRLAEWAGGRATTTFEW